MDGSELESRDKGWGRQVGAVANTIYFCRGLDVVAMARGPVPARALSSEPKRV